MTDTRSTITEKTFKDKHGNLVLGQSPNALIVIWIVFTLLSFIFTQDHVQTGLHSTASAALFAWSYLEITQGINHFRRILGVIVGAIVIINYFMN